MELVLVLDTTDAKDLIESRDLVTWLHHVNMLRDDFSKLLKIWWAACVAVCLDDHDDADDHDDVDDDDDDDDDDDNVDDDDDDDDNDDDYDMNLVSKYFRQKI